MDLTETSTNELLFVGFNQDFGCIACGTRSGFRIYNVSPFKETFRREWMKGGIGRVEMLFRCNILALIGGGPTPRYPPHKVMIWDDHQDRCIGELSFRTRVMNVKLRRDRVVIALSRRVYVHNFADLSLLTKIHTAENPLGLLAVSSGGATVVASPHTQLGKVVVHHLDAREVVYVAAHDSPLASLALNLNGSRLATASERGTLIRVFDTTSGAKLQEVRRGTDRATIHSLAFNADCTFLACTSDKGTCHVFRLAPEVRDDSAPLAVAPPSAAAAAAAATSAAAAAAAAGAGSSSSSAAPPPSGAAAGPPLAPAAVSASASGPPAAALKRAASVAADGASGAAGAGGVGALGDAGGGGEGAAGGGGGGGGGGGAAAGGDVHVTSTGHFSADGEEGADAEGEGAGEGGGGVLPGLLKGFLPSYFSSEWSFAQFRVPEGRSICAFGAEPFTVVVVTADGLFFKANFAKGGEAVRLEYSPFLKTAPTGPVAGVLPGSA